MSGIWTICFVKFALNSITPFSLTDCKVLSSVRNEAKYERSIPYSSRDMASETASYRATPRTRGFDEFCRIANIGPTVQLLVHKSDTIRKRRRQLSTKNPTQPTLRRETCTALKPDGARGRADDGESRVTYFRLLIL